jgi:hypothetical protein
MKEDLERLISEARPEVSRASGTPLPLEELETERRARVQSSEHRHNPGPGR